MPKKNDIVIISNKTDDVFPLRTLTEVELNLFYTIASKVKDLGSDKIELGLSEITELSHYSRKSAKELEHDLYVTAKKLFEVGIQGIRTENGFAMFALFTVFEVDMTAQTLKVSVNERYAYLLNNLVKEFSMFELQEYVSLSGLYAKRLYRFLKKWRTQGRVEVSLDDLKDILVAPQDITPRRFSDDIVNPAVNQIGQEKKYFRNLECTPVRNQHKRGRPLEGYLFTFRNDTIKGQITFDNYENGKYMPTVAADPDGAATKTKVTKRRKKNSFDMQERQDYDISAIEKQILAN